ncbi:hypothetical protein C0Q70_11351 [Pomacea canaliculata]|uniref:Uncharacterized protein n=1 Tax=Pomacea canaliculata TaxID=400727 RepID=A0A2T7P5S8_POMCA|nr:hypothetical protein C0Q70_11351 [Pomacea canaliculata]
MIMSSPHSTVFEVRPELANGATRRSLANQRCPVVPAGSGHHVLSVLGPPSPHFKRVARVAREARLAATDGACEDNVNSRTGASGLKVAN